MSSKSPPHVINSLPVLMSNIQPPHPPGSFQVIMSPEMFSETPSMHQFKCKPVLKGVSHSRAAALPPPLAGSFLEQVAQMLMAVGLVESRRYVGGCPVA